MTKEDKREVPEKDATAILGHQIQEEARLTQIMEVEQERTEPEREELQHTNNDGPHQRHH